MRSTDNLRIGACVASRYCFMVGGGCGCCWHDDTADDAVIIFDVVVQT